MIITKKWLHVVVVAGYWLALFCFGSLLGRGIFGHDPWWLALLGLPGVVTLAAVYLSGSRAPRTLPMTWQNALSILDAAESLAHQRGWVISHSSQSLTTELARVDRITVIGNTGVEYERYGIYADGAVLLLQDGGRTLKIAPRKD